MKHYILCAFVTFAILLAPSAETGTETVRQGEFLLVRTDCVPSKDARCPAQKKKSASKRKAEKQKLSKPPIRVQGKRVTPRKNTRELTAPRPLSGELRLTPAQKEKLELFTECINYSTKEDPVESVKEFIFSQQKKLEEAPGWQALLSAIRGSKMHQTKEICFARAYGLKGFRSLFEIRAESGRALVPIRSPYVEIVENEIPPDRRLARNWTRDYIIELGEAMHRYFADRYGVSAGIPPLRVTSIIRSFEDQAYQVRRGKSPADCRYQFLCSTHTTGSAFDLGFRDLNPAQKQWLQDKLIADQRERKIYFIVERDHFHIFVLPPEYIGEE